LTCSRRAVDKTETIDLLPPQAVAPALFDAADITHAAVVSLPPVRAGPRLHLINAQFNE